MIRELVCVKCSIKFVGSRSDTQFCSLCKKIASNDRVRKYNSNVLHQEIIKLRRLQSNIDQKENKQNWHYLKRYGITLRQAESFIVEHGSACEICGKTDDLVIDHNHDTNELRGLLCRHHNVSLGLLEDGKLINKVLEYLSEDTQSGSR